MDGIAFAIILQARPCPVFGRPVRHWGRPHRLRPGASPHALRTPPHDGRPALPAHAGPARHYPRFRIWLSPSENQRDFNPPDQCAAPRTLCPRLTPRSACASGASPDKNANCNCATSAFTSGPEPGALASCAALPGPSALYAVSVRRLTALPSGFLPTVGCPPQLPSAGTSPIFSRRRPIHIQGT